MTTQHQWQVTKMAIEPEHDSLKNVVVLAEWKLTSTSEDGKSVQRIGAESFEIEQETTSLVVGKNLPWNI